MKILNIPQLNCLVLAAGQQKSTVRGKRYASNRTLVSFEDINLLTLLDIPQADCFIFASGGDPLPVRRKGNAKNIGLVSNACGRC